MLKVLLNLFMLNAILCYYYFKVKNLVNITIVTYISKIIRATFTEVNKLIS